MKVVTILGTRPEIIRLSRVLASLDEHTEHVLVHTGQNSDFELNEVFFSDLCLRAPDHFMGVDRSTLGSIISQIILESERILAKVTPDALLVLGDTNSALAALMARRMCIPIYHMEAGNRCFDLNVPEETNRRIIDHISDYNLVYTEHARRNLLAEGIHPRRIYLTGSPMAEVLEFSRPQIERSDILVRLGLRAGEYFLVSAHRAETVDVAKHLHALLGILNRLCVEYGLPIIVSTHPRTRQRLEALADKSLHDSIRLLPPFGFNDYVHLQMRALCTLSDSGTISEESSILGFPAITMRNSMERPEAMDAGTISLTGLQPDAVLRSIRFATSPGAVPSRSHIPGEYQITNTSLRVTKLILGTAKLSHLWDGIEPTSV